MNNQITNDALEMLAALKEIQPSVESISINASHYSFSGPSARFYVRVEGRDNAIFAETFAELRAAVQAINPEAERQKRIVALRAELAELEAEKQEAAA